jgi:hypothetical protein
MPRRPDIAIVGDGFIGGGPKQFLGSKLFFLIAFDTCIFAMWHTIERGLCLLPVESLLFERRTPQFKTWATLPRKKRGVG